ncbi:hypothetical protein [uncultured Maribacter sp.]|uniref:hypothetical protein n=1 Tax=uncultured Maribacter sp. TaxID=431308 RepID=UPI002610490F|nr:hypothetical protein [uncultured Maribacter sp.]
MSGPKVVCIVTPQERQIIKDRWLSQLAYALKRTEDYARNNNLLDKDLEKGLTERYEHFANLTIDDYLQIEQEVPQQIEFLNAELKKLQKKVASERTTDWDSFKHLKSTHNELKALSIENNISIEPFNAPSIITKSHLATYKLQIDKLYEVLQKSISKVDELSEEQLEMQQRLSQGDSMLSVTAWKAKLPGTRSRLRKLEDTLKEMYVHEMSQEKIQTLIDRCSLLDSSEANYEVQLDSLIIDAAEFTKNELALREAREDLSNSLLLIETLGEDFKFIPQWREKLENSSLTDLLETAAKASAFYKNTSENRIVEARRIAIKSALEKAGYTINETMQTAWVEDGRLVVKKESNSLYGVEIMSPTNLNRIQARVVADENRSNERSPSLDKNEEETWCDNIDHIRTLLADEDLEIIIDKMEEPGAIPLKEVPLNSGYESRKQGVENKRRE